MKHISQIIAEMAAAGKLPVAAYCTDGAMEKQAEPKPSKNTVKKTIDFDKQSRSMLSTGLVVAD